MGHIHDLKAAVAVIEEAGCAVKGTLGWLGAVEADDQK